MSEEYISDNVKLIEIIESTKKKFHEHVNVIYQHINKIKTQNQMENREDPNVALIINELNVCIDEILGTDEVVEINLSMQNTNNMNNEMMLEQLICTKKELEDCQDQQESMVQIIEELNQQKMHSQDKYNNLFSIFQQFQSLFPNYEQYDRQINLLIKDIEGMRESGQVKLLQDDKYQLQQQVESLIIRKEKLAQQLLMEYNQEQNILEYIMSLQRICYQIGNRELVNIITSKCQETNENYEALKHKIQALLDEQSIPNRMTFKPTIQLEQKQEQDEYIQQLKHQIFVLQSQLQNYQDNQPQDEQIYIDQMKQIQIDLEQCNQEKEQLKSHICFLKEQINMKQNNQENDSHMISGQEYQQRIEDLQMLNQSQLKQFQTANQKSKQKIMDLQNQIQQLHRSKSSADTFLLNCLFVQAQQIEHQYQL